MIKEEQIKEIVEAYLAESDCFLTDLRIEAGNRIVVEIDHADGVSLDRCIGLSREIERHFDREVEDFELEVGSAGLSSPLKHPRQWQYCIGREMEILLKTGVKERGKLLSASPEMIGLEVIRKEKPEGAKRKKEVNVLLEIAMEDIKKATQSF